MGKKDILYILDHATHLVKARLIHSKKPEEVANRVIEMWFSQGMPQIKKVLTDNGNEFTGQDTISKTCQKVNNKNKTTAGYNPQQNDACEHISKS